MEEMKLDEYKKLNGKESEHAHQVALFDLLRANESKYPFLKFIFAIPNGGLRNKITARKMKAEGVKRGVFDIFFPFYVGKNKHGLFIEMKFGKNKTTPEQNEFKHYVTVHGFQTAVCYSWEEAAEAIENYLGIELKK